MANTNPFKPVPPRISGETSQHAWAVAHAQASWPVFPTKQSGGTYDGLGPDRATTNLNQIDEWFTRYKYSNPSIATGWQADGSGFDVVSIYPGANLSAEQVIRGLYSARALGSCCYRIEHPDGHFDLYYPAAPETESRTYANGMIQVRGRGEWVTAPGSLENGTFVVQRYPLDATVKLGKPVDVARLVNHVEAGRVAGNVYPRLTQVTQMVWEHWQTQLENSWVPAYMSERGFNETTVPRETYQGEYDLAPISDGYNQPLREAFGPMFPVDAMEHPEQYGAVYGDGQVTDLETIQQINSVLTGSTDTVRIYRGLPAGMTTINHGDWISLSKNYAQEHANRNLAQNSDGSDAVGDVIFADVPAAQVFTNGNSLEEWGWNGEAITGTSVNGVEPSPIRLGIEAGYAPESIRDLETFSTSRGVMASELVAAGLAYRSEIGTLFPVFKDRAIFPIRDADGKIIAFTGRKNPNDTDPENPKYKNSPNTEIYTKSSTLFGLTQDNIERLVATPDTSVIICEGAVDQLAYAHALAGTDLGIPVADLGTSITRQQLDLVKEFAQGEAPKYVFSLDGDIPGWMGMERAWSKLDQHEKENSRIAVLPEGSDPAQMLEDAGSQSLRNAVTNAEPAGKIMVDRIWNYDLRHDYSSWNTSTALTDRDLRERTSTTEGHTSETITPDMVNSAWEKTLTLIESLPPSQRATASREVETLLADTTFIKKPIGEMSHSDALHAATYEAPEPVTQPSRVPSPTGETHTPARAKTSTGYSQPAPRRFDHSVIEAIHTRVPIAEVVGARVELHAKGTNSLEGLCPFHEEKTPSFHVRPIEGDFHCFGCGEHGDVISFIEKTENMPFPDVVRSLADAYGIDTGEPITTPNPHHGAHTNTNISPTPTPVQLEGAE